MLNSLFAFYQPIGSQSAPVLLADLPQITQAEELSNYEGYFHYSNDTLIFSAPLEGKITELALDFNQGAVAYRRQHGGGRKQHIAKACALKHHWQPNILDATGGLGRDAAELRNLGAHLRLIERSPFVASLLQNAIQRAALSEQNKHLFEQGFVAHCGQASELIPALCAEQAADIIYLDPMFPPKNKSAAVKKEMRLVKLLVGADPDADQLLPVALAHAKYRVVVKRPSYAPFLNQQKPSMSIESKGNRFDVYVLQGIKPN